MTVSRHLRSVFSGAVLAVVALCLFGASTAWATSPPVNTVKPSIKGTQKLGYTLTAIKGSWTESPTSYTYQWLRCNSSGGECVSVPGATGVNYHVLVPDHGRTLKVKVSAFNGAGEGTEFSNLTGVISPGKLPEFIPTSGKYPVLYSYRATENVVIGASGLFELSCEEMYGLGEITGPSEVGAATLTISGCRSSGFRSCATLELKSLTGYLGYVNKAEKQVGLVLEKSTSPFGTINCFGAPTEISGSVIGQITPVNVSAESFSLRYSRTTGTNIQVPDEFEGGPLHQLEFPFGERFSFGGVGALDTSVKGEFVA
jgi:hypothetical protein